MTAKAPLTKADRMLTGKCRFPRLVFPAVFPAKSRFAPQRFAPRFARNRRCNGWGWQSSWRNKTQQDATGFDAEYDHAAPGDGANKKVLPGAFRPHGAQARRFRVFQTAWVVVYVWPTGRDFTSSDAFKACPKGDTFLFVGISVGIFSITTART